MEHAARCRERYKLDSRIVVRRAPTEAYEGLKPTLALASTNVGIEAALTGSGDLLDTEKS